MVIQMGTNYYLNKCHEPDPDDKIHIGKSSAGWCFSLRVYPERKITNFNDWLIIFSALRELDIEIRDEYGHIISVEEMIVTIVGRCWHKKRNWDKFPKSLSYDSWEHFHKINHSEPGPNGLLRHQLMEGHCVGHGVGTYD